MKVADKMYVMHLQKQRRMMASVGNRLLRIALTETNSGVCHNDNRYDSSSYDHSCDDCHFTVSDAYIDSRQS